jgi:hypothetical protein
MRAAAPNANTRHRFAVTRWRSEIDSNPRSRWSSAKGPISATFLSPPGKPIEDSEGQLYWKEGRSAIESFSVCNSREMIEIRACAADFAQLVAAENAPNRGFGRFGARFIRRNQIRGHDEKAGAF